MTSEFEQDAATAANHRKRSLRYARLAGYAMAAILAVSGLGYLLNGTGFFKGFQGGFFLGYALIVIIPYSQLRAALWKPAFILLTVASILFVFVMIASVMFGYMEAAERGERLGVPGFEGTLIFGALLQVPVVLFQRKPDLLD